MYKQSQSWQINDKLHKASKLIAHELFLGKLWYMARKDLDKAISFSLGHDRNW